jgi:tRNA G18 (ribose-2'-O)-methylase SpoU
LRRLSEQGTAYRRSGQFWIEGEHLCSAAVARGMQPAVLVVAASWLNQVPGTWQAVAARTVVLEDRLFADLSALESPSHVGFVMDLPAPPAQPLQVASVVLDRVQDAGNVGSILRSAAAFGFRQVLALQGTAGLWSAKVLRAGMGAHFGLQLIEGLQATEVLATGLPLLVTSSHQGQDLQQAGPALALRLGVRPRRAGRVRAAAGAAACGCASRSPVARSRSTWRRRRRSACIPVRARAGAEAAAPGPLAIMKGCPVSSFPRAIFESNSLGRAAARCLVLPRLGVTRNSSEIPVLLSLKGTRPPAILALADGTVHIGESIGAPGSCVGEVVFNTAITGYQEILTDPSYCQQIVTLTYPHIGNYGTTGQDAESTRVQAAGLIIKDLPLAASNFRSEASLSQYLLAQGTVAIAGLDTRKLTRHLRTLGAQNGCILALPPGAASTRPAIDMAIAPRGRLRRWPAWTWPGWSP